MARLGLMFTSPFYACLSFSFPLHGLHCALCRVGLRLHCPPGEERKGIWLFVSLELQCLVLESRQMSFFFPYGSVTTSDSNGKDSTIVIGDTMVIDDLRVPHGGGFALQRLFSLRENAKDSTKLRR
jgi:hypothetical protein